VNRGAALVGALLVTLATPVTWLLGLGAFLVRGGIVLVALPVVVLPTPVGLANLLGPTLTPVALGAVPAEFVVAVVGISAATVVWLLLGGWLAAAMEAEGIRVVAADEDVAVLGRLSVRRGHEARTAGRILAARLVAAVPLIVALLWGSVRLVAVTYRELTSPFDVATPIAVRVIRASPEVVLVIGLAWMAAEIVGAIAARRIVLRGEGVTRALRGAAVTSVRHPLSVLARFWLPLLALLVVLAPAALATGSAWDTARGILGERADPLGVLLAVVLFVLLWAIGLLLLSVVCGWRAAVWTVAVVAEEGTFGGSADRQTGDWRPDQTSATL
jgi:hypothetical protein